MEGFRFYLEFPDHATKKRSGKANAGHLGSVIAAMPENHSGGNLESLAGLLEGANPQVASTMVSWDFLREKAKRIPEKLAREIHPALFERLDKS